MYVECSDFWLYVLKMETVIQSLKKFHHFLLLKHDENSDQSLNGATL